MKIIELIVATGIIAYFLLQYIYKKRRLQVVEKEFIFFKLCRSVLNLLTKSTKNPNGEDFLLKSLKMLIKADSIALFEEVDGVFSSRLLLEISEGQAMACFETIWPGMYKPTISAKDTQFYTLNLNGGVVHITRSKQKVLLCSFPANTDTLWLKAASRIEKNVQQLLLNEVNLKNMLKEGGIEYLAIVYASLLLSCRKGLLVKKEGPGGLKVICRFGELEGETLSEGVKNLLITAMRLGQPLNFGQKIAPVIGDLLQWQFTDVLVVPVITQQGITGALFVADKLTKVNRGLPYSAQGVAFIESIASFVGNRWDQESVLKAMKERLFRTIQVLVVTLEARDRYTRGHSENVAGIARAVALKLGLDSEHAENIYLAGILHDIGKIGIPETVLNKLAPLSEGDRAQIREHPQISRKILEELPEFYPILNIVEQHHERWDGLGYPRNLSGEEIELSARILAVADSFDAMISSRTYQKAKTPEEALKELVVGAGSQWDPKIIDSFIQWWTEENLLSPIPWNLKFTRKVYKDILASATKEKIFVVDKDELAGPLSVILWERVLEVKIPEHLPLVRKALEEWLIQKKINAKKIKDLVLTISEIGTNTLKHGKGGELSWGLDNEGNFMIFSVDKGDGFNIEKLPQSLLVKGFSTKQSLGYGFSIILEKCKSVILTTDSKGSIILVNCGMISQR